MRKFVTLFTDSYKELRSVRTITLMAMFAAIAIILGMYSIEVGNFIRISFASIPNGIIAYLFGPVVGGIFAGVLDVLKFIAKPTGAFFPPLTLVTILAGVMQGCMYYKKPITLPRVFVTKFIVMLVCNVILNTMCLSVLYGDAFMSLIGLRALKNLIMWPIDSMIFYSISKVLENIGLFNRKPNVTSV